MGLRIALLLIALGSSAIVYGTFLVNVSAAFILGGCLAALSGLLVVREKAG